MKTVDSKISLVLGSHAHVSYGAGPDEFERVYIEQLRPFLTTLYRYPRIQAVFHYSGVLLHWVERAHHELFMLMEDMVSRKQVEMLGGGFYDPILPIIPPQNRIDQVEHLTTYIRRQFGKRPLGCWVPEYAWEQGLVSSLASCGMGFTFLGERQFAMAGAPANYPCICEDQGKLITVFPVSQSLEASLPDKSVSALLEDLCRARARRHETGEAVVSIFPGRAILDGGGSQDEAWNRFFEELSLCEGFVETVSPGKVFRRLKGLRKVYIPDSHGDRDSVPARRFIIEHPEAGRLYSKMIFTNMLVTQLRGDKSRKISAYDELWKSQSGALFCRTGRGGIQDNTLRNAAYGAMLGAERITREAGKFEPSLLSFDFDLDGEIEWLFHDTKLNCYVKPRGGGIFELDYLPKAWNYLDTCGDRVAFADRLLPAGTKAGSLEIGAMAGARNCHNERYEPGDIDKVKRRLHLGLPQGLPQGTDPKAPFGFMEIEKRISLRKDAVLVRYSLANRGAEKADLCFSPEIDLSLPGESDAFVRFFACRSGEADRAISGAIQSVDAVKIHDIRNEVQLTLAASKPFDGRILPVHVSDGIFQVFCIMPLFHLSLGAGKAWETEFTLRFSH